MGRRARTALGADRCVRLAAGLIAILLSGERAGSEPIPEPDAEAWPALAILGSEIAPGDSRRLALAVSESFSGSEVRTPVAVVRGVRPGPTLCLTAGVHGDEVNGVEIARRVLQSVKASKLRGTVIVVPIVNLSAFRRGSRYLPDRRDLNRYFPGRPGGSAASRIAHNFFDGVVRHCSALVDVHTGSFFRSNLHQVRADLSVPAVVDLAQRFGSPVVVHNPGREGTLRRAAVVAGIPAITLEAGEPTRFDEREVELGVAGFENLLAGLGMRDEAVMLDRPRQQLYRRAIWVRVDEGGILVSRVGLGDQVEAGQVLGSVADPLSDDVSAVRAPYAGRVIGIAFDQLVMPGFAAYHLGIASHELGQPGVAAPPPPYAEPDEERDGMDLEERPE